MNRPRIGRRTAAPLPEGWERFYRAARRIPRGRVVTYGMLAGIAGWPRAARQAGYAMAALHGTAHEVPWHRVLGAASRQRCCIRIKDPVGAAIQRQRLEAEGVVFDASGHISLERFGWSGSTTRKKRQGSMRSAIDGATAAPTARAVPGVGGVDDPGRPPRK